MKKLTILLSAVFATILLVGCAANTTGTVSKESPLTSSTQQSQVQSSPQQNETSLPATVTQKPESLLDKQKAKDIAFKHAGVKATDASRIQIDLDFDDDTKAWEYEIDFHIGTTEYEYEIDAQNGNVIHFDKDIDD